MGKFGKNRLPKFMNKAQVSTYGSNPHEEISPEDRTQLIGIGLANKMKPIVVDKNPTDYSVQPKKSTDRVITIRTVNGENKTLLFSIDTSEWYKDDDHPMYIHTLLSAEDDGILYKIPVFLYDAAGQLEDVYYDEIEAEPIQNNSIRSRMEKNNMYVAESFQDYVNNEPTEVEQEDADQMNAQEPQPCENCDHASTLSEKAKAVIKQMCNETLIHEARIYEDSDDPNQTYETFLTECTHYMAECLIRAAQNIKV